MKKNNLIIMFLILFTSCQVFNEKYNVSPNMYYIRNVLGNLSRSSLINKNDILKMSQDYYKLKDWKLENDSIYTYKKEKINNLLFEILENKKSDKVIYLLHGGAFYTPLIKEYNDMMLYLTKNSKYNPNVYMLDYDVYPNKYPIAHNQAYQGYVELLKLGFKPENIIILGDSAGGHLTVSTIHRLKDNNIKLPNAIILYSPWLDISNTVLSRKNNLYTDVLAGSKKGDELTKELTDPFYFKNDDKNDKYISPLIGDFSGFPITYIQVEGTEILLDDSKVLYNKINKKNINKAYIDIFYGNLHDFQLLTTHTKESIDALNKTVKMIDKIYNKEINDK